MTQENENTQNGAENTTPETNENATATPVVSEAKETVEAETKDNVNSGEISEEKNEVSETPVVEAVPAAGITLTTGGGADFVGEKTKINGSFNLKEFAAKIDAILKERESTNLPSFSEKEIREMVTKSAGAGIKVSVELKTLAEGETAPEHYSEGKVIFSAFGDSAVTPEADGEYHRIGIDYSIPSTKK